MPGQFGTAWGLQMAGRGKSGLIPLVHHCRVLIFRYTNGSTSDRRCTVYLNGENVGQVDFFPNGRLELLADGHPSRPRCWLEQPNTIRLTASTDSGGPNLDGMTISGSAGDDIYEAGKRLRIPNCSFSSEHAGYTGSGYLDYGGNGSWCEFSSVTGQEEYLSNQPLRYPSAGVKTARNWTKSALHRIPSSSRRSKDSIPVIDRDPDVPATATIISSGRLTVWADAGGAYGLYTDCPRWVFKGNVGQSMTPSVTVGADVLGSYEKNHIYLRQRTLQR